VSIDYRLALLAFIAGLAVGVVLHWVR